MKKKDKYVIIDMGGLKHFFKTKREAKKWSKYIYEKTAMYPHIYTYKDL